MATKKAGGSTRNGRDSEAKRLGVKLFEGQTAKAGSIIIRQRGTKYFPGTNVRMGRDHTLFSVVEGLVSFTEKRMMKFNGRVYRDKLVHVTSAIAVAPVAVAKKAAPKEVAEAVAAVKKPAAKKAAPAKKPAAAKKAA